MITAILDENLDRIRSALSGLPGTALTKYDTATVTIEHYPAVVSRTMIVDAVKDVGYAELTEDSLGPLERRLKRMADSSQAAFGTVAVGVS